MNNNIIVFYHVLQVNQWEKLYQEQINSIIVSGLYHKCDCLYIGVNGNQKLPFVLEKMKVFYNGRLDTTADTLKYMWNLSKENSYNMKILYLTNKGVTRTTKEQGHVNTNAWRIYLEYFLIHRWKECVSDLERYDCVGSEWVNYSGLVDENTKEHVEERNPHYSGDCWWANSEYIRKLDPNYLYNTDRGWLRFRGELWIGTKNPDYKSYHNSCKDLFCNLYSPEKYIIDESDDSNIMLGEWCYFKSYFSKEYCNLLLETAKCYNDDFYSGNMGVTGEVSNLEFRNVMCMNLDRSIFSYFYKELWHLQTIANKQWFNFLVDETEVIQLLEYDSKVGAKYEKHQDTFWITPNQKHRKLTAVVQLSDSDSYSGGDLTLFNCAEYPNSEDIRQQGTVIFFPSFIFHKANKVTSGIRHSAVSWFLGPKFR